MAMKRNTTLASVKNKFAIFLVLSLLPAVSAYPQVKFKPRPVKFKLEKYVFRDEPEYAGDSTRLIEILSYDEGENQVEIPVSEAETLSTISMVCEKPFKYYYKNYGNSDSTGNRPKLLKDSDYFFTVSYDPYQPVISSLPPVGYFLLGNIMVLIAEGTVPPFLKREGTVMTFDTYYRDYDVRNLDDMGEIPDFECYLPQWTIVCRGGKLALISYISYDDEDDKLVESQRDMDNIGEAYIE